MGKVFGGPQGFNPWFFMIIYELNMGLNDRTRFNEGIILTLLRIGELRGFSQGHGINI